ncbi:DNA alkylation repair protein [Candidatus Saccharibacteria bacterium]|nr:DNA alkylation repair protein [Candidatus Saccharibacteria bacterium]
MTITEIRAEIEKLSEGNEQYAEGNKRIVNTQQNLSGVRMPDLRILAKDIAHKISFNEIQKLSESIDKNSYEEVMLVGMVIGYAKLSDAQKIELFRDEYLKLVDSWAQIDSITNRKMNTDEWWDLALECLKSPDEFTVRFGVMVLMDNFLKTDRLDQIFAALKPVQHEGYYVKMGIAWLYATAALVDYEKTLHEVEKLERWTRHKALTKMLESYRFTDAQKQQIKGVRDRLQ